MSSQAQALTLRVQVFANIVSYSDQPKVNNTTNNPVSGFFSPSSVVNLHSVPFFIRCRVFLFCFRSDYEIGSRRSHLAYVDNIEPVPTF